MRITYLHQYFNSPDMNGSTRSFDLANRLVKMGHEVNIITSWREGNRDPIWTKTEIEGVKIHWYPIEYSNKLSFYQRLKAFSAFIYHSGIKAASIKSDVVYATSTPLTIAIPGVYAARKLKVPMVLEIRDVWPQAPIAIGVLKSHLLKWAAYKLESWAYRKSKHIVSLSPTMTEDIKKSYPDALITEIPNSSDIDRFSHERIESNWIKKAIPDLGNGPVIVYAGTFGAVNNVGYLVKVAIEASDTKSKLNFVVIGDGVEKAKIYAESEREGVLNKNFFMLPPVPKKIMPEILAASDLSLSLVANIPELWGNSANKFFDSLAASTPIAVNHLGWQAELIEKHKIGLVLPINNPGEAVRLLVDFFSDATRVQKAGQAANDLATNCFDINLLSKKLNQVLLSAVNDG